MHEDSVPKQSSKYFRKTSSGYLEKLGKTLGKLHTFEPQTTGVSALTILLKNSLVIRETHKGKKSYLKGPTASSAKIQRNLRSSHKDLHCKLQCIILKNSSTV